MFTLETPYHDQSIRACIIVRMGEIIFKRDSLASRRASRTFFIEGISLTLLVSTGTVQPYCTQESTLRHPTVTSRVLTWQGMRHGGIHAACSMQHAVATLSSSFDQSCPQPLHANFNAYS